MRLITICSCIIILGLALITFMRWQPQPTIQMPSVQPLSAEEAKLVLNDIYEGINAFSISEQDRELFQAKKSESTYGEIIPESLEKLVEILTPTRHDIFYDLGSGKGQAPLYMALRTPMKKCVGIELATTRHAYAQDAHQKYNELSQKPPCDLQFYQADFTDPAVIFDDATIVWMNSTCYPDTVMQKMVKRLSELKRGLRVVTLKPLPTPENYNFRLIQQLTLPMTWSQSVNVYIYVLEGPTA